MTLIACKYFLSCNLMIEDDLEFMGNFKGRKYCIKVNQRDVKSINSFTDVIKNWSVDDEILRTELKLYSNLGEEKITQEIFFGMNDFFKYGYIEHSIANVLSVMFDDEDTSLISNDRISECLDLSSQILHNFIDIYRYTSAIGSIPNPDYLISPVVELLQCEEMSICNYNGNCDFKRVTFRINSKMKQGFFGSAVVGNDILDKLYRNLMNDRKIELYEKLILDSREQALIKKDYNISIVLVESAFEVYLKKALKSYCEENSITRLRNPFKYDEKIDVNTALEYSNIQQDILYEYFQNDIGISMKEKNEFKKWKNKAYKRRNKIIHNGIICSKNDATEAFVATMNFINYIDKQLSK